MKSAGRFIIVMCFCLGLFCASAIAQKPKKSPPPKKPRKIIPKKKNPPPKRKKKKDNFAIVFDLRKEEFKLEIA